MSMHRNDMVVTIRANGKVLREMDENGVKTVYLPFGTEYTINFNNLSTYRAAIRVTVDGEDVLDGTRLVLSANSESVLKGKMKGNVAHNSFKFIKMSDKIADHRDTRACDGIIRVSWQFERPYVPPAPIAPAIWDEWHARSRIRRLNNPVWDSVSSAPQVRSGSAGLHDGGERERYTNSGLGFSCHTNNAAPQDSYQNSDQGITVEGSVVDQGFGTTYLRELFPEEYAIVLELRGETSKKASVTTPLTTRAKPKCSVCGTRNRSNNKYCANCSACLV